MARAVQPKCHRPWGDEGRVCTHSKSFHGGEKEGPCRALGCHCPGYHGEDEPDDTSTDLRFQSL